MSEPPTKAYVHIGAPKTGTTFVQSVLWANREQLAADGVLYPYEREPEHFPAMLDLREQSWGDHAQGQWAGAWDTVAERASGWSGHTAVLGNEILGGASERQIRRLAESLAPAEVHVVFTARDLARQLVSDWQEHIKHQHTVTLERFVDDLIEYGHDAPPPFGEMFWGLHDATYVLERWARVIPRDRIHLVTLPPPGAPRDTLWRRFCSVTGLDADRYSLDVRRSNTSLGRAEAEVVRRINARVRNLPASDYDALVRLRLTGRALNGSGGQIVLPEGRMPWVRTRSRELVEALGAAGYDVTGDLDELMPRDEDHTGYVATRGIPTADMLPVAIRTSSALLRVAAHQRARLRSFRDELGYEPAMPRPEPARPRVGRRVRLRQLLALVRSSAGRLRVRRRSRRSR